MEKESRVLIRLQNHIFDLLDGNKNYLIKLNFSEKLVKEFKLQFAPEITSIEEVFSGKQNLAIKKFLLSTARVDLSDYKGEINMKLYNEEKLKEEICKACQYKK